MSRTKVSEWSSSASANTDINGININEGCPPQRSIIWAES
jgi:hypothetical protein